MDYLSIYVTTKDEKEAVKISTLLLEEKLIACSNILPGMKSLYRWKNKIETSNECVLFMKTEARHYTDIEMTILANHSYDTPCILAFPIVHGQDDYLDWISNVTA